jgi:hypothetical protein
VQGHSWRIPFPICSWLIFDLAVGVDSITQLPFPFGSQVSTPTSHTTPHSPCCVPMIFDGSSHFKNSVPRHSPGPVFMEPAAADTEHWPHTRRNKRGMLPPPSPRLPLSSSHERGEAVWLTLLFHPIPLQETNSIPSTDQRRRRTGTGQGEEMLVVWCCSVGVIGIFQC